MPLSPEQKREVETWSHTNAVEMGGAELARALAHLQNDDLPSAIAEVKDALEHMQMAAGMRLLVTLMEPDV